MRNLVFDSQLPPPLTIIVSWGPSLAQMPAPHHIHLTCMLRMTEMTVSVFYRVTTDKVISTPRITHTPRTVTLGSCGCYVMLFTLPNVSSRDSLKRSMLSPDEVASSLRKAYSSKCASMSQRVSVDVPVTQKVLSSKEISSFFLFFFFKSQLPIWYCQNVSIFVSVCILCVGKWLLISIHNIPCPCLLVSCYWRCLWRYCWVLYPLPQRR